VNPLEHTTKETTRSDQKKSEQTQRYVGYVKREEKQMILSQQTTTFQASPTHPCYQPIDPVIQEEKTHHHQNYELNNRGSRLKNMKTNDIPTPNSGLPAKSRKSLFLILEN
jgi:hypothetical protein